jgi:hypothetical protein
MHESTKLSDTPQNGVCGQGESSTKYFVYVFVYSFVYGFVRIFLNNVDEVYHANRTTFLFIRCHLHANGRRTTLRRAVWAVCLVHDRGGYCESAPVSAGLAVWARACRRGGDGMMGLFGAQYPSDGSIYDMYPGYLESERWQWIRKWRLRLDWHKCRTCPRRDNLTVHHAGYHWINRWGNVGMVLELLSSITLCKTCHGAIHKAQPISVFRN